MIGRKNKHANEDMPTARETLIVALFGVAIAVFCYVIFNVWPNYDLEVSRSFTGDNSRFDLRSDDFLSRFRQGVIFLIFFFYVLVIGGWIDAYFHQKKVLGHEWHRWSFLGTAAMIGPVLIVNVIFKGNWGRARPQFLEEFGGSLEFSPFWQWSDQCRDNCSFPSGEVSAIAMVFLSIAFLLPRSVRYVVYYVGLICTVVIAWKRIALGSHFLSDTLMSVSFMCICVAAVYWFMYLRPAGWIDWFDEKQRKKLDEKAAANAE